MKKFLTEFKEFAMRGNVLDMAIGVVIGGAFSKIVTSFVTDVITPGISYFTGKIDFTKLSVSLIAENTETGTIDIFYGKFLQSILDFLITAFCIFCVVSLINKFKRKKEVEEKPVEEKSSTDKLLTEIRDLLKEDNKQKTTK